MPRVLTSVQAASGPLFLCLFPVALGSETTDHSAVLNAGEMPLAGYRVVDAFGYDVRAFVLEHQLLSSGHTCVLQQQKPSVCGRWRSCPAARC